MTSKDGLIYIRDFITKDEEKSLLEFINNQVWNKSLKRYTQHYGYEYNYKYKGLKKAQDIPEEFVGIVQKVQKYFNDEVEQIIVNRYLPGEGIGKHTDDVRRFGDTVASLSLCSPIVMNFESCSTKHKFDKDLEARSLLVLNDVYRYGYTHEIKSRLYDNIGGEKGEKGEDVNRKRTYRISITFRSIKK